MRNCKLRTTIFISFIGVTLILGIAFALLGFYLIQNDILKKSQQQVSNYLKTARFFYNNEIESMKNSFLIIHSEPDLVKIKQLMGLDYIFLATDRNRVSGEIALQAFNGLATGGTRIIGRQELAEILPGKFQELLIGICSTPRARPDDRQQLASVMAFEYATPYRIEAGTVKSVLYGGKIINRDYSLIDKIHTCVFENETYGHKPIGTVTIFQDDVRVATNVLNAEGDRATGTRVSEIVYNKVIKNGGRWIDRAFVVTDWYLTAYEPISDITGRIIGILYVGILEKPFRNMMRNMMLMFLAILTATVILVSFLTYFLARLLTSPLLEILAGINKVTSGDLSGKVQQVTRISEFNILALDFNIMAGEILSREQRLLSSNQQLTILNQNYLELIGFVSHELKGILSSIIMNAYSIKDGFLGDINPKQQRALDSITRNLDYLTSTIKKFLNLSRIEKGDLVIEATTFRLKEELVEFSLEAFAQPIAEKGLQLSNRVQQDLTVTGDRDLLMIVLNNLVSNAVKYGKAKGVLRITAAVENNRLRMEVYNDGETLTTAELNRLFKRFSRLEKHSRLARGTGLGLFITRQIIEKHGGKIWVEPRREGNAFCFSLVW